MFPSSSISIFSAAGLEGRPGILIMVPAIGIINPAPAAMSNSRILRVNPEGRLVSLGSSEREYCVFAMQQVGYQADFVEKPDLLFGFDTVFNISSTVYFSGYDFYFLLDAPIQTDKVE
jgi:hypothetical protein